MLTYANINMKITWQGYGVRLCLKLILNKLKKMKGPTLISTLLEIKVKETSKEAFICASSK
jgi:hypothetical protein